MIRLFGILLLAVIASQTTTAFVPQQSPATRMTATTSRLAAQDSNDILNTAAFLKRKLEVMQSDVSKVHDAMAVVQERLEQGKAEYGAQLADLQNEVRKTRDAIRFVSTQPRPHLTRLSYSSKNNSTRTFKTA